MSETSKERPGVGIATIVLKDGKILLGRDTKKGDEPVYGVPGGHWENGETLKEGAMREVREESGVTCENVRLVSLYESYRPEKGKSYVSIGMCADFVSGDLTDLLDEGRSEWDWYTPEEALKLNLFAPDRVLIEHYLSGIIFE